MGIIKQIKSERIWLLALVIILCGCEQKVKDANIPSGEPQYVIEGLLVAGQQPKVFISRSSSIQSGLANPDPASIEALLLRNGQKQANLQAKGNGYYGAKDTLRAGNTYTLQVKGALDKASGTTTIPGPVPIQKLRFEDSSLSTPNTSVVHALKVTFRDPPKPNDRYIVSATLDTTEGSARIDLSYFNPAVSFGFDKQVFMKDQSFNGERFGLSLYIDGTQYHPDTIRQNLVFRLKHVTDNLFQYYQSLSRQEGNSGSNPFSSEPALTRGNITNGYGCAGGLNVDTAKLVE